MAKADEPTLGEPGETCSDCGFPLATDQRYCLNCGRRRGDSRLDFARYLAPQAAVATAGAAAVGAEAGGPARQAPVRDSSPQMAVAGIALLGLMLLVGVLIGRGGEQASTEPTVVRVGEASTAATTDTTATDQVAADTSAKGKDAPPPAEEVVASTEELETLAGKTGEEYQEASKNLPNTIATPGEAPAKDNEKPGGGSTGVTID